MGLFSTVTHRGNAGSRMFSFFLITSLFELVSGDGSPQRCQSWAEAAEERRSEGNGIVKELRGSFLLWLKKTSRAGWKSLHWFRLTVPTCARSNILLLLFLFTWTSMFIHMNSNEFFNTMTRQLCFLYKHISASVSKRRKKRVITLRKCLKIP